MDFWSFLACGILAFIFFYASKNAGKKLVLKDARGGIELASQWLKSHNVIDGSVYPICRFKRCPKS